MSRILDAYGRPIESKSAFVTPSWVMRAALKQLHDNLGTSKDMAAEQRVMALRESVGEKALLTVSGARVGTTINIRKPERYTTDAR